MADRQLPAGTAGRCAAAGKCGLCRHADRRSRRDRGSRLSQSGYCASADRHSHLRRRRHAAQALDDLLRSYALLRRYANREEAMVAAGRLSMAQFSVRDYSQALSLVDETIAFFREEKAQIRLATALDRRAKILKAAGRLE